MIVLFFAAIGGTSMWYATKISPLTKQEEFLPVTNQLIKMRINLEERFVATSISKDNLMVKIHWGVKGLDRDGVGAWNVTDVGKLIWDMDFDISPAKNQLALLELCEDLRNDEDLVQFKSVTCWIEEFRRFVDE